MSGFKTRKSHNEKERKKKELHIKTWDQKLGLRDNAPAMAGLVFIIAFSALIITT